MNTVQNVDSVLKAENLVQESPHHFLNGCSYLSFTVRIGSAPILLHSASGYRKMVTQLHKQATKIVPTALPTASGTRTAAPVIIMPSVPFHQNRISSCQQLGAQFRVILELADKQIVHNFQLRRLPV